MEIVVHARELRPELAMHGKARGGIAPVHRVIGDVNAVSLLGRSFAEKFAQQRNHSREGLHAVRLLQDGDAFRQHGNAREERVEFRRRVAHLRHGLGVGLLEQLGTRETVVDPNREGQRGNRGRSHIKLQLPRNLASEKRKHAAKRSGVTADIKTL